VLTGDHQAGSNAGHYKLTTTFLDIAEEFGATGRSHSAACRPASFVEEYTVSVRSPTATSSRDWRTSASSSGQTSPPAVSSVSGLVLRLGGRRGFDAACLMGETSGYLVDPKSARAVRSVADPTSPSTTRAWRTAPRRWRRPSVRSKRW